MDKGDYISYYNPCLILRGSKIDSISLFKGDNSISVRKTDCSALRRMYFIFSEAIILLYCSPLQYRSALVVARMSEYSGCDSSSYATFIGLKYSTTQQEYKRVKKNS